MNTDRHGFRLQTPVPIPTAAGELEEFFRSHRGRCFPGWDGRKIADYLLVQLVHGNVFVARAPGEATRPTGPIAFAAIAWLNDAERIVENDRMGLPQYDWNRFPSGGDSILIADVAGDRSLMPEILKQVMARVDKWHCHPHAIFQKRLFTYRRGKLVEPSWKTIFRFGRAALPCRSRGNETLIKPTLREMKALQIHSELPHVSSYEDKNCRSRGDETLTKWMAGNIPVVRAS